MFNIKLSAFVMGFFGFGGLYSLLSYHFWQDVSESRPIWMVLLRAAALLAIPVLFLLIGALMSQQRKVFIFSLIAATAVGLAASRFFPSYEFATDVAIVGMLIAMLWTAIGMELFLRSLKK